MILYGKEIAKHLLEQYSQRLSYLPRAPELAVILVGDHPSSRAYITMKERACKNIGITFTLYECSPSYSQDALVTLIERLNTSPTVDGILVQLPLPSHIDTQLIMMTIDPQKDVDGFHPENMGKLLLGDHSGFVPCTPLGIQTLLVESHIDTVGKHVVIVGRSNIVGKPLAALLIQKNNQANATVTIAHSHTPHLDKLTQQADILIAAIGRAGFIQSHMIKQGAVVIDVGISRESTDAGYILVGDVDFKSVAPKCAAITPVPGGVGPMTVAMLVHNTIQSCTRRCGVFKKPQNS